MIISSRRIKVISIKLLNDDIIFVPYLCYVHIQKKTNTLSYPWALMDKKEKKKNVRRLA